MHRAKYLFKVNNQDNRKASENFDLVSLLLPLNKYLSAITNEPWYVAEFTGL